MGWLRPRIHLSTAVWLMLAAGILLYLNIQADVSSLTAQVSYGWPFTAYVERSLNSGGLNFAGLVLDLSFAFLVMVVWALVCECFAGSKREFDQRMKKGRPMGRFLSIHTGTRFVLVLGILPCLKVLFTSWPTPFDAFFCSAFLFIWSLGTVLFLITLGTISESILRWRHAANFERQPEETVQKDQRNS